MADERFLTDAPIDRNALVAEVMRLSDGACIVFEGAVRNHHEGREVDSIFYDAYRPMAEKEIGRIVGEVSIHLPDVAIAVRHRLGELAVGDVSIIIGKVVAVAARTDGDPMIFFRGRNHAGPVAPG